MCLNVVLEHYQPFLFLYFNVSFSSWVFWSCSSSLAPGLNCATPGKLCDVFGCPDVITSAGTLTSCTLMCTMTCCLPACRCTSVCSSGMACVFCCGTGKRCRGQWEPRASCSTSTTAGRSCTRTHARTHARTRARARAHTHTHTHTYTHTLRQGPVSLTDSYKMYLDYKIHHIFIRHAFLYTTYIPDD